MSAISRIHAREVLDSRGNPTVEVEVHCAGGAMGRAIVPSGASTGKHEAVELRDGDSARYGGKGVRRAVANIHEKIAPRLLGIDPSEQKRIDRILCELDGTPNKSDLGANAILGVSLAVAHAAAAVRQVPLWRYLAEGRTPKMPLPMINMISGGLHAGGNLAIQDILLLPIGARTYSEALAMAVDVYRSLSRVLKSHNLEGDLVGDEGGFGPRAAGSVLAMERVLEAISKAGLTPGRDAALAIDVASTHFFDPARKVYSHREGLRAQATDFQGMIDWMAGWVANQHVLSIEDGLAEDDWPGWEKLTQALGKSTQLIGDDLFVTNPERLKLGIEKKVANSVLVKVNQIGTLTETFQVIDIARAAGYRPVISARSGETEDSTIADLAVATGAGQIKIGSVARGERLAKYNQLLRIEEELPGPDHFAGWQPVGNRIS